MRSSRSSSMTAARIARPRWCWTRGRRACRRSACCSTSRVPARAQLSPRACGTWIATLDGDGQNDPADFPRLLEALLHPASPKLKLVMGNRTTRRDTWLRRLSSRVANGVRGWILEDGTPDTGCGIKVFERDVFMHMPRFRNMHRFMPALVQREGFEVISLPVNHRERTRGTSKYGLHNRLWVGIVDLFGLSWLLRRPSPRIDIREEG
jgi:dolichol-phosphate mannosyltransferase